MYRGAEDLNAWEDAEKRLGRWRQAFTGKVVGPNTRQGTGPEEA